MNDQIALKTNRYALRALKDRRAEIAGEIRQLKIQLKTRKLQLVYIDASILLLDPSADLDKLPAKRTIKHVRLFKRGELGRLILGALREANGGRSAVETTMIGPCWDILKTRRNAIDGARDPSLPALMPRQRSPQTSASPALADREMPPPSAG